MRSAGLIALAITAGCRFTPGTAPGGDGGVTPDDDGSVDDAAVDDGDVDNDGAPPPDGMLSVCPWPYTPLFVDPCAPGAPPPGPLVLSTGTHGYDTDTGVLKSPANGTSMPPSSVVDGMRIVWTTQFTLGTTATLRATGSLPLVIVSTSTILVEGEIDVASHVVDRTTFSLGAGANPSVCPTDPPFAGQTCANHGGSGGGGGGFGGTGGTGGEGGDTHMCDGMDGKPGGIGGVAIGFPATLRGGCPGADGAQNNSGTEDRGRGGAGGGAIQLVAYSQLEAPGVIHAGGAGGTHGNKNRSGGGGGGTGGMIVLEAQNLVISGRIAANGGGGGGGCDGNPAMSGSDGLPDAQPALGGMREGMGSNGANGGYATTPAFSAGAANRGGGGGGGSVGFIKLRASSSQVSGVISPPETP